MLVQAKRGFHEDHETAALSTNCTKCLITSRERIQSSLETKQGGKVVSDMQGYKKLPNSSKKVFFIQNEVSQNINTTKLMGDNE